MAVAPPEDTVGSSTMHALSASQLLDVWEQGLAQQSAQRALTLLSAASPQTPPDMLAERSIGHRDADLLTLREWTFGSKLASVTTCPACRERLELSFNVADIRVSPESEAAGVLSLSVADYDLRFRLPNSRDLAAFADRDCGDDAETTSHRLLERCLLDAQQGGKQMSVDELPADVIDAIVERMAGADPQADVQLALNCPVCEHQWKATFDILTYFWSEIEAWVQRTLREVHSLASAYGWREADILAMSAWRRRFYLQTVGV